MDKTPKIKHLENPYISRNGGHKIHYGGFQSGRSALREAAKRLEIEIKGRNSK